jgi:hypothetical protein
MTEVEISQEMQSVERKIKSLERDLEFEMNCPTMTARELMNGYRLTATADDIARQIRTLDARWNELDEMEADEDDEFAFPPGEPKVAPNKIALWATYTLSVIGFIAVGMLLSAAIILDDKDLMWSNVESFWKQIF